MNVLVLGGSGSLGLEITKQLLRQPDCHIASSFFRNPDALTELQATHPSSLRVFRLDLQDIPAIERTMYDSLDGLDGLDVVINAAGLGGKPEFLIRAETERIAALISINLTGPIIATRFAIPLLLKKRRSAVMNISSVSSIAPTAGVTAYAAAKAGIEGFTGALAKEYASRGLSAACIRLGPVDTPMIRALKDDQVAKLNAAIPGGVLPTPHDLASFIVQMVNHQLDGTLNGTTLTIDSGYVMWRHI